MNSETVNPYASPRTLSDPLSHVGYFSTATRKLSFREYWWMAKNPFDFALGIVFKLLYVNLPNNFAIAHPRFLQILEWDDLPTRARACMTPGLTNAMGLGFEPSLCYCIPQLGSTRGFAVAMRGSDGTILFGIGYAHSSAGGVETELCKFFFASYLQDGRVLSTLGGKPDLESPPEVLRAVYRDQPVSVVFDRHQQRIRELGVPTVVIRDHAEVERVVREREERNFDYQVERGVLVPLTEQELRRIAAPTALPAKKSGGWLGMVSWIVLGAGLILILQGPPVNQTQRLLQLGLLILGALGVMASKIIGRRDPSPGADDSNPR